MYLNDKILNLGEITVSGEFALNSGNNAFYVFIVPKSSSAANVAILSCRVSNSGNSYKNTPIVSGTWNPIVVKAINVASNDLSSYRIFWGTEE